jgi:exosortase
VWHARCTESLMRTRSALIVFVLLWLALTALLWRPFTETLRLALSDSEFTHIILILPISAALIFSQWNLAKPTPSWSLWAGLALGMTGVSIALSARWWLRGATPDIRLSVAMVALVIFWIAAFALSFGARAARSMQFPLAFLFWMVPLPSFLLMRIIQALQQGSAIAAGLLFSACAVPISRHGVVLSIPGLNLEVARECSSIRSSLMLLITTMVLAHVLLRSVFRRAAVVAIAVPLSVAKNGLRIFTLGMLGTRVDPSFLTGRLHHEGGGVFFLIALLLIALLVWVLHRAEESASTPGFSKNHPRRDELAYVQPH